MKNVFTIEVRLGLSSLSQLTSKNKESERIRKKSEVLKNFGLYPERDKY